ncbi:MAG TPA: GAF domain-containing protein, partial [Allocoleopsis sp.]
MEQTSTLATQPQDPTKLEQNLTQIILSSKSFQDTLSGLAQAIAEALGVEGCLIVAQPNDRPGSTPISWYASDAIPPFPSPTEILTLFNQASFQLERDNLEPLVIPDLHPPSFKLSRSARSSHRDAGETPPKIPPTASHSQFSPVRSVLALNTQFQGQVNGLVILLRSQPYHWKDSDVQLLKTLSPQVAIALSQTHLEQQVHQQIRYQNLINQLTTAIRNNWDLNRTFQLAIEGTAAALQVDRGMILLFKYTDPLHRHRQTSGIPKTKARIAAQWMRTPQDSKGNPRSSETALGIDGSFWASDCSLCQQILLGQPEVALLDTPDWIQEVAQSAKKHTAEKNAPTIASIFCSSVLPSLLLVPLENQGTILGCLSLQHQHQRSWSPEEIVFVKLVAAQLSTAIIQSRTMQQIQAVVQERTAQLQRSLEVQAKLYEKTRQQVEQLRQLTEEREEFLSTVSHELRTPLTSMTLAIRMLRQANLSPERQEKYLDILEQQCIQETQLINDLLALRKLESSSATAAQLQRLDIRYLIRDIAQSIEEEMTEQGLILELDLPSQALMIHTEADSVSRIVMELLTNAKKYSQPNSVVRLQVTQAAPGLGSQPGHIMLKLHNIGDGISPEELPHIFDKFRRGRGVTKQAIQGTGLGLALVKGLVEHLGGTIVASSHPQEQNQAWDTCF